MKRTLCLIATGLLLIAGSALSIGASESSSVEAAATYTGGGQVSSEHRLFLWVFATPPAPGTIPISWQEVTENGKAVTFEGLTVSPVYIAVTYDEAGGFDPNMGGPPPSGTPAGIYSSDGTGPTPVEVKEGKKIQIKFEFDDSFRMP